MSGAYSEGVGFRSEGVFDPEGQDNDATNRNFAMQFGHLVHAFFVGNFADKTTGVASGFDKLGSYGWFNGTYSFLLDINDDGVGDLASVMPSQFQVNGIPVAGNFNAAHAGDEIGVFDRQAWYLELNGNKCDFGDHPDQQIAATAPGRGRACQIAVFVRYGSRHGTAKQLTKSLSLHC